MWDRCEYISPDKLKLDNHLQVNQLIEKWAAAVRRKDIDGVDSSHFLIL